MARSKFSSEVRFLLCVKDAAAEALEAIRAYQEAVSEVECIKGTIEEAREDGDDTSPEEVRLKRAESDLQAAEKNQRRAFEWFHTASGINLDD